MSRFLYTNRFALFTTFAFVFFLCVVTLFSQSEAQGKDKTDILPGKYIVVLKDEVENNDETQSDMVRSHGFAVKHKYDSVIKGYAIELPEDKVSKLREDKRVKYVSEDRLVHTFAQSTPTGIGRIKVTSNLNKGDGIGVAVLDTGINISHPDLKNNIVANVNCVNKRRSGDDDNGHGTHVAGTIAAINNTVGVVGVAPGAKLIAVKVLDSTGSGSWSSIICGIDWITANASKYNIKVANMSLGGGGTSDNNCGNSNMDALHKAICNSTAKGITYVVAAGNSSANAAQTVPASYNDTVITVSALADSDGKSGGLGGSTSYGADDTFASFSNFGSVVDISAPGVSILSTWRGNGYSYLSGTSMATPHVAGAAALYIKSHPGATWLQVKNELVLKAELLGAGHTDPSGIHPEPVLNASSL